MELILNESGGFDIVETKNRKIINKYFDYYSKLYLIEELDFSDKIIYYTTIDFKLGVEIDFEKRKSYFNYDELCLNMNKSNLKIKSKRVLNSITGKEVIHEQIIDQIGNVIFSRQILAFNKEKIIGIEELYEKNSLEKEKENLFWSQEYYKYSFDDKVMFWIKNIHQGMRMQGETTNDPYSEFSESWYEFVKSKEQDFDSIFKKVAPKLGVNFDWEEYYKRIKK